MKLMSVFVVIVGVWRACAMNCLPKSDLIQSGNYDFAIRSFGSNRVHSFQTNIQYQVKSQHVDIALTTSTIGAYIPIGFQFNLKAQRKGQKAIIIQLIIANDYRWTFIKVDYFFSSRSDLHAGLFEQDPFLWNQVQGNLYQIQITHQQWRLPSQLTYNAIAFISSFETEGSFFKLAIKRTEFHIQNQTVIIQFQPQSNPQFSTLTFSYIVFPTQHNLFRFSTQPLSGFYSLKGPSSFQGNKIFHQSLYVQRLFLDCTGEKCEEECISKQLCSEGKGKIFKHTCYLCEIIEESQELKCSFDSQCKNNEIWDPQVQKCVCNEGTYKKGDSCEACPEGTSSNSDQTSCSCLFFSQIFVPEMNKCIQCPRNSWPNTDKTACNCMKGFIRFKEECRRCPFNSVPSEKTCSCLEENQIFNEEFQCEECPLNYVPAEDKKSCVCRTDFEEKDGECIRTSDCPQNSSKVGTQCQCNEGFYKKQQNCLKIPSCPLQSQFNIEAEKCVCKNKNAIISPGIRICLNCLTNQIPNKERNKCLCEPGYEKIGLFCEKIVCFSNAFFSIPENKCICREGYELKNNLCQKIPQCPNLSIWDSSTEKCICQSSNAILSDNGCIQCGQNQSPVEGQCRCDSEYVRTQGVCTLRCNQGSTWNEQSLRCECTVEGQHLIDGECRSCSLNEIWNGQQCICEEQHHRIEGVCRKCSKFATFNGTECQCKFGFFPILNSLCFPCHKSCKECTGPKVNECLSCLQDKFKIVDGICEKEIICPENYFKKDNICTKCSKSCQECSNQTLCDRCQDGFQIFQNQTGSFCEDLCGDGKRFTLTCDDGNLQNGDGCSDQCTLEQGWQCGLTRKGGLSQCFKTVEEDNLLRIIPDVTVQYVDRVFYTFKIENMPECAQNFKNIFKIQLFQTPLEPRIKTNYDAKVSCQLLVEFSFNGIIPTSPFSFRITINPELRFCLGRENLFPRQTIEFDPSLLITFFEEDQLSPEDIGIVSPRQERPQLQIQPPSFEPLKVIGQSVPLLSISNVNFIQSQDSIQLPENIKKALKCRGNDS